MSCILISTMGLSPGVVTSAYFRLVQEYSQIDKVISVTTTSTVAQQCEQIVWDVLQEVDPNFDYEPLRALDEQELRNSRLTNDFASFMEGLLWQYSDDELYLVLTGGRKSMVAALMSAVQRYTFYRPDRARSLKLFHLETIDPDIEERGNILRLGGMKEDERRYYLNPPENAVALVELPFLPLAQEHDSLQQRLFVYGIGDYLLEAKAYEQLRYRFPLDELANQENLGEVDIYAEKVVPEAIDDVQQVDIVKWRQLLLQCFDKRELDDLLFELGENYEDVPGERLSDKAREIVLYFKRRQRLRDLLAICIEQRPKPRWTEVIRLREVILCDCVWQQPISAEMIDRLAEQAKAVHNSTLRPVQGWLVTSVADVDDTIRDQVQAAPGVSLWQASLPANWQTQAAWQLTEFTPLVSG